MLGRVDKSLMATGPDVSGFLDQLKHVGHSPLTYIAFLMVIFGWLGAWYFFSKRVYPRILAQIPEKDRTSALTMLLIGLPAQITDNRLTIMRWRYAIAVYAITLIFILIVVGILASGHPPLSNQSSATPPALKGVLDVLVWPKGQADRPGKRLYEQGALPLKPADCLRIEATLGRPAYLYLVWLDSSGVATPLWPWAKSDWRNRPADRDRPRQTLSIPAESATGHPLDPGPSGIESLLLLVRETPLPAGEDLSLRFAGQPKQAGLNPLQTRVAAWFENGEPVRDEPERVPINLNQTQAITDPLWRTRALLRDELQPLFPYTRAVCFAFRGT